MDIRSHLLTIATACMVITLLTYRFVYKSLEATPAVANYEPLMSIITAVGIYVVIFQTLIWIYAKWLVYFLNPEIDLVGSWYQIFVIEGDAPIEKRIRHGECNVRLRNWDLSISAVNHKLLQSSSDTASHWDTEAVAIQNAKMHLIYRSQRSSMPAASTTCGTMHLVLTKYENKRKPTVISGVFSDSMPWTNYGRIVIYRNRADYERQLDKIRSGSISDL